MVFAAFVQSFDSPEGTGLRLEAVGGRLEQTQNATRSRSRTQLEKQATQAHKRNGETLRLAVKSQKQVSRRRTRRGELELHGKKLHVSRFTAPDDDVTVTLWYARREFVAGVGEGRRCFRSWVEPGGGFPRNAKSLCKDFDMEALIINKLHAERSAPLQRPRYCPAQLRPVLRPSLKSS